MEFRAASIDWMDRVSVLACERDRATGMLSHVAAPLEFTMKPHEPGAFIQHGTLELDARAAVSLMDALWHAGVRPSDFKSPNGEINRLEAHLADMRKLVFKPGSHGDGGGT